MNRKKIIAILTAIIMLGTVIYPMQGTILVHATTTYNDGTTEWTYQEVTTGNETYIKIISRKSYQAISVVNIPIKINNISVGEIGSNVFKDDTALTTVRIPSTVYQIGMSAFQGCTALTTVTIPSTVYQIGMSAFQGCTALTTVTFSDNVNTTENLDLKIDGNAFKNCKNLKTINFRKNIGLLSVGTSAFASCENLVIEEFPFDVELNGYSFANCYSFKNLTFKGNATLNNSVFAHTFQGIEEEEKVTFEKK